MRAALAEVRVTHRRSRQCRRSLKFVRLVLRRLIVGALLFAFVSRPVSGGDVPCYWDLTCEAVKQQQQVNSIECRPVRGGGTQCIGELREWESIEACSKPSVGVSDAIICCVTQRSPGSVIYRPRIYATNMWIGQAMLCAFFNQSDCVGCVIDVAGGIAGVVLTGGVGAAAATGKVYAVVRATAVGSFGQAAFDCVTCVDSILNYSGCCFFRCEPDWRRGFEVGTRPGC
jgi:hypothetical protein